MIASYCKFSSTFLDWINFFWMSITLNKIMDEFVHGNEWIDLKTNKTNNLIKWYRQYRLGVRTQLGRNLIAGICNFDFWVLHSLIFRFIRLFIDANMIRKGQHLCLSSRKAKGLWKLYFNSIFIGRILFRVQRWITIHPKEAITL